MKIIHANCSVEYQGRGNTKLAPHDRIIMVKEDNSVLIHNEKGIKPLNYMTGVKSTITETDNESGDKCITFDSNKESLTVIMHRVYSEVALAAPNEEDAGLERDGTEEQLQTWLSENLSNILPCHDFIEREHETGAGPVDLLAMSKDTKKPLLIEVKRVATRAAVHQVRRYLNEYQEVKNPHGNAILVALNVRPSARDFAENKNIPWLEVDWNPNGESAIKESWFPDNWNI